MLPRREALKRTALAAVVLTSGARWTGGAAQKPPPSPPNPAFTGVFKLPALPYPADALEPAIDAQTMTIHHDRHHAAYVAGLNKAVADAPELAGRSVEDLLRHLDTVPEKVRTAIRNHGGGHFNHSLFWQMLKPNPGAGPSGPLAGAIDRSFGSLASFRGAFDKSALAVFGSGWAWLTLDGAELRIETSANQDSPLSQGRIPLLGVDVWEHAYYLKYQNRRTDYLAAFHSVINWDFVASRFQAAQA